MTPVARPGRGTTVAVAGAVVATALVLAGLVGLGPVPAASAAPVTGACAPGVGVTVVVEQPAGTTVRCAASAGGGTARKAFVAAEHDLVDAARTPGFVCRIDGFPTAATDACVVTPPASAYWSLWTSNRTTGTWSYAQLGADSLRVPAGTAVAFRWNTGGSQVPPSQPAPTAVPTAAPTAAPLPARKLAVSVMYRTVKAGKSQRVTVKGLVKGEPVRLTYAGKTIARATSTGTTYTKTFKVGPARSTATVKAVGAHSKRLGSATFRVRR